MLIIFFSTGVWFLSLRARSQCNGKKALSRGLTLRAAPFLGKMPNFSPRNFGLKTIFQLRGENLCAKAGPSQQLFPWSQVGLMGFSGVGIFEARRGLVPSWGNVKFWPSKSRS
jgi:hypothetical protein